MIAEYNKWKSSIETSDQMSLYNTSLRRTVKWYHKIPVECLFGRTPVNSIYTIQRRIKKQTSCEEPQFPMTQNTQTQDVHCIHTGFIRNKVSLIKSGSIAKDVILNIQKGK